MANSTQWSSVFWSRVCVPRATDETLRSLASDTMMSMDENPIATYQTRVRDYAGLGRTDGDAALSAYAELYGRVERNLFASVAAGKTATSSGQFM